MRALLDTSFFVATESGRPRGEMDGVTETEVSVVTLAELTVGVLIANDDDRPARVATLSAVESRGIHCQSTPRWQDSSPVSSPACAPAAAGSRSWTRSWLPPQWSNRSPSSPRTMTMRPSPGSR